MRDVQSITDIIRKSVSALRAGEALGLRPDRNGRCACPVHHGKDRNMKLWADDRGYHCFVCHAGGDVIGLVRDVCGYTFWQAVEWLNSAFHLGLPIDRELDEDAKLAAKTTAMIRKLEKETERITERAEYDLYTLAAKTVGDLEEAVRRYRPTDPDAEWDERFCAALRALPEAREAAGEMALRVMGVEK